MKYPQFTFTVEMTPLDKLGSARSIHLCVSLSSVDHITTSVSIITRDRTSYRLQLAED